MAQTVAEIENNHQFRTAQNGDPTELLRSENGNADEPDYRNRTRPNMKDKYIDLIEQSFDFPQDEFTVEDNELNFHDIPLMELIKQYGTPLKITYLPKISQQINRAKRMFNVAMAKADYKGIVQLLLLHQVEPLLVRAGGGHEERHPPRNLVGLRHPHHQRALRRRHHRQGPLHHLQRLQAPAVRGEHRAAGERRLREHDPRARQQGGDRPVRGRLHPEVQRSAYASPARRSPNSTSTPRASASATTTSWISTRPR